MQIYIAGIHTDIGKTHVSLAICNKFNYDYFKLIQAGNPKDSDFIKKNSPNTFIFNDGITLQTAASPHIGKVKERLNYNAFNIQLPKSNNLIIELAGGLFSPIDENICMIDYIYKNPLPTILVGKYYIGAINHVLLSIEALKQKNIELLCVVMNGKKDKQIDDFIKKYSNVNILNLEYFNEDNFDKITTTFKKSIESYLK